MLSLKSSKLQCRLVVDCFLLVSIFVFPWPVVVIYSICAIVAFEFYIEAIVIAYIYEIIYAPINIPIYSSRLLVFLILALFVWEAVIKPKIRIS